jgi:hypothetical protein
MTGRIIVTPCADPQAIYALSYASAGQHAPRPGPSDRFVATIIRSILTIIVLLPCLLGALLTFALLLAGSPLLDH